MNPRELLGLVIGQTQPENYLAEEHLKAQRTLEDLLTYLIEFEEVRRLLAEYPKLGQAALAALAQDERFPIQQAAARNPMTPPTALAQLIHSSARLALAQNPATPAAVLHRLATEGDTEVRRALGSNPACPAELLLKLGQDEELGVLRAVAENPSAPTEVLLRLANRDEVGLHRALVRNSHLPLGAIVRLMRHPDPVVQNLLTPHLAAHKPGVETPSKNPCTEQSPTIKSPLQSDPKAEVARSQRHH